MSQHYKIQTFLCFLYIALSLSSCDFLASPSNQRTGDRDQREDGRPQLSIGAKLLFEAPNKVSALGSSDNGDYLALIEKDQFELLIFDQRTQSLQSVSHHAPIRTFDFSPFHNRIVTASDDGTALMKNLLSGAESEFVHAAEVSNARFSNSGYEVVTGSKDGTARITDWRTGEEEIIDYGQPIEFLDISSDDRKVLVAAKDRLSLYDRENKELRDIGLKGDRLLKFVQFFADAKKILYLYENDSKVYSYDIEQGVKSVLVPHERDILSAQSFGYQTSLIVSSSRNGVVKITNYLDQEQVVLRMDTPVREINLSSNRDFLVFIAPDGEGDSLVWYSLKEDTTTKHKFKTKIDYLDVSPGRDGILAIFEDGRVIEFSQ